MTIIDTHAHLDHLPEVDPALDRAAAAGVEAVVAVSVDTDSIRKILEIRRRASAVRVLTGLGIHPGNIRADAIEEGLALIREHAAEACAVGEIGLDFWYKWVRKDRVKKDEQREVFRRQLVLARELGLPVIIHSLGTWRECLETTRETGIEKAVFHWYSGPVDVLKEILDQGYLVSTTASLAYSPQSREAMAYAPVGQTLIETDSPVFFRHPDGGEDGYQSEPKDVVKTWEIYAAFKGLDPQEALAVLNRNARGFFGLDDP